MDEANEKPTPSERRITTAESRIAAYVSPTNEELEIARACLQVVSKS
jgi:acetate kinase